MGEEEVVSTVGRRICGLIVHAAAPEDGRGPGNGSCSSGGKRVRGLTVHVAADRNVRAPVHLPSLRYGAMQGFNVNPATGYEDVLTFELTM